MDRNEKMVARQRDRAITSILDFKERSCDEFLPDAVSRSLRKVVLDNVNDLTNLCIDLLEGAGINDLYLEKIDSIHEWVEREKQYDGE